MTNLDNHIQPHSSWSTKGCEPVILLLIQNAQDRRLFKQLLPDYVTVEASKKDINIRDFDLCILDEQACRLHKTALESIKRREAPLFLPILLLSQNQKRLRKTPGLIEFADDVVYIPASRKLLKTRIDILLQQREYSLKLEEKNQQLEEANKELKEEKEKYQLLADNSTDMISVHKPDGTYLYVSPASEELIGYTPEELVGKNAFDNIHPEDRAPLLEAQEPFADNEIVRFTFRKGVKSGGYKWVESTMRPIRDEETGEITEIQAGTRDISARKEYERRLKEEKEFTDKAIESLPELFYMIDEDQNFIKWTNIERELGYTDEEVKQMHPLDFYRKEDQKFIISKIVEAFKTGNAEAEIQMISKSGELIPYYITAKRFSRGDDTFLVGTCVNLSEIKETQYELEQHRQLLDAVINQTKSLIYLKDEDRKYQLVNDSYLDFYDLEREEIIGKTDVEVHGEAFAEQVGDTDYKVLEHRQTSEFEEIRSNKEGDYVYHTIKYPLQGVPGFENCMCGISTDITELKQASNQLQERIKEQRCLYKISSLPENVSSIDELLQRAVHYLPSGWQFPEIAEAKIEYGDKTYKTDNFKETEWQLSAENNRVEGKPLRVQVAYREAREMRDEGPFLEEERQLINTVADSLASQLNRIRAQRKLKESEKRWESLVKNDPDLIQILDREGTIHFINQAGANILGFECPDDIIGKNYFDLVEVGQEESELTDQRMNQVLEGNELKPQTFKIRDSNGKVLYMESQAVPITLDDGRPGIQQVAQDVTDRMEYERKLKQSLKEKETLLQEIHHRVKNNLAVVSGMMELQTFNTENKEVKKLLSDSKNRIKTMALIHEKLYQSESLSHIDFGSYVQDLLENIRNVSTISGKVEVNLTFDSFSLNVNQAVPTALVINEIVTNSFEHAFNEQEEGHIEVSIRDDDDIIKVIIQDDGCGLQEGFQEKKNNSMGYTIIETLLRQLEAEKHIENKGGLLFSFNFKKQEIKGSSSSLV